MPVKLDEESEKNFVHEWFNALDVHADPQVLLNFLVDQGLTLTYPEQTMSSREQFSSSYRAVTHLYFDEVHTLGDIDVTLGDGVAIVSFPVHWKVRMWVAPAPHSDEFEFDATQTWHIVPGDDRLRMKSLVVNSLNITSGSEQRFSELTQVLG